ncbi:MAG: carbon-phosphorus lyase complex subunit PhnI [Proteobacteria bacterium]|nr:carbon-phosphorus lyase complex subunit PhnI [Pseudomonadota bacterium]MBU1641093.1 carbon-phosphorus lyase complex subunit PhnI [Pseudomonadota bacterium]
MSYVAIKGGGRAIQGAEALLEYLRTEQGRGGLPLDLETIQSQLRFLHGRVMSEGGLYHPELAALAIKQFMGDSLEAAFALRAYRSTKPRLCESPVLDTGAMRLVRRISSAFKDIPGGQMLGASPDFSLRLLRLELLDESPERFQEIAASWLDDLPDDKMPDSLPKVLDHLRQEGLLPKYKVNLDSEPFDITREPLIFPVPRSAALATMARAETGSLLGIAYSNMRGYGDVHPTVAEMRVGYLPILLPHPVTGEAIEVGEVLITECEVVAMYEESGDHDIPRFTLGYGACFGHNEVKALAMAILDRSLQKGMRDGPANPSEDPEFVLLHIDGIDSMGFCTHYKMPHYVTFQSDMDRLRTTQKKETLKRVKEKQQ